jgi:hypothetical protein
LLGLVVTTVVRTRSVAVILIMLSVLLAIGLNTHSSPSAVAGNTTETVDPDLAHRSGSVVVLVQHQLDGLTNPGSSTGPVHLDLIERGLRQGIHNPFGLGVSQGTIADKKADPSQSTSAESDIGNTMAGLGLPAGFALAGLIVIGLFSAVRLERIQPSVRHLAWLGILVVAFNQWLNGALYCTSSLLFLCLGGLSREVGELSARGRDRVRA